jgi:glyoxylase-like metal-dependent hydrolase (beta-lactamase superfamily II)
MREVAAGLWHWRAPHPGWQPGEPWDPEVSSYALDDGRRLLLLDPLSPPAELERLAATRQATVVLTCPWHERDAQRLVEGLGVPIYAPAPDTAKDLMRKFGVSAEQAGAGSPDLGWLRAAPDAKWHRYAAGDRLPLGIEAFPGREHNDMVLWLQDRRTVICGDTLVDVGDGLEVNRRLRAGVSRADVVAGLRPLLDRPVELVALTHGEPVGRAALERALV